MAKDIPSLARASLVTIAWISCFLHLAGDKDFQDMASSILTPRLLESSNSNRVLEERVLATFSLQQIRKTQVTFSKLALAIQSFLFFSI